MKELKEGLGSHMSGEKVISFEELSKKWAIYSLETYSGELLKKSLMISASLIEFADELNDKRT